MEWKIDKLLQRDVLLAVGITIGILAIISGLIVWYTLQRRRRHLVTSKKAKPFSLVCIQEDPIYVYSVTSPECFDPPQQTQTTAKRLTDSMITLGYSVLCDDSSSACESTKQEQTVASAVPPAQHLVVLSPEISGTVKFPPIVSTPSDFIDCMLYSSSDSMLSTAIWSSSCKNVNHLDLGCVPYGSYYLRICSTISLGSDITLEVHPREVGCLPPRDLRTAAAALQSSRTVELRELLRTSLVETMVSPASQEVFRVYGAPYTPPNVPAIPGRYWERLIWTPAGPAPSSEDLVGFVVMSSSSLILQGGEKYLREIVEMSHQMIVYQVHLPRLDLLLLHTTDHCTPRAALHIFSVPKNSSTPPRHT